MWESACFLVGTVGVFEQQGETGLPYFSHRGADKSLARPGRKQATAAEGFDVHISYL